MMIIIIIIKVDLVLTRVVGIEGIIVCRERSKKVIGLNVATLHAFLGPLVLHLERTVLVCLLVGYVAIVVDYG